MAAAPKVFPFVVRTNISGGASSGISSLRKKSFGRSAFTAISSTAGWWTTLAAVLLLGVMIFFALRAKTWRRFELKTEMTSRTGTEAENVHVGDRGVAYTRLAPLGTGRFGAISCEVKSYDNQMVAAGTPLEVVAIEENKPLVKPVTNE